jgi:hypothetical protein
MQASESGDMPRGSMVVDAGTDQSQGAKTRLVSLHGDEVACRALSSRPAVATPEELSCLSAHLSLDSTLSSLSCSRTYKGGLWHFVIMPV